MTIVNPTPTLKLERQAAGTNANVWGDRLNYNMARIDAALGAVVVSVASGDVTLTTTDSSDTAADAQTRYFMITANGSPGVARNVIWPATPVARPYILTNASDANVTFKVTGQTGVTLAPGGFCIAFTSNVDIFKIAP